MEQAVFPPDLRWLLGGSILLYVVGMYALGLWARGRIQDATDFLVAGRRLPLSMAWMTLMATWFGAGTLLAATDEIRREGVERAALDPFGAGCCLLLAGLFLARPLWRMGLLTIADFFRRRFGPRAEVISALILVPSYFGWVAAQFVALAGMLELVFGLDLRIGLVLVALVGMGYTWLGGMWSVTLTDVVQISLVLFGLIVLSISALTQLSTSLGPSDPLGDGSTWSGLRIVLERTPPEKLRPIPLESLEALAAWVGIFCVGALGNLPGQDLMQRVFSAKSERVASRACLIAGTVYLSFGLLPILLGLVANLIFPDQLDRAVLPALAGLFLSPPLAVIFTVAVLSAVLSTIDSAILSPSSVLAQNVLERWNRGRISSLALNRFCVVLVTAASLFMAYLGESAYALLEDAYELVLVALFVPLVLGIYLAPSRSGRPAVASMLTGFGLWLAHEIAGWGLFLEPWLYEGQGLALPSSLAITVASLAAYLIAHDGPLRWRADPGRGAAAADFHSNVDVAPVAEAP